MSPNPVFLTNGLHRHLLQSEIVFPTAQILPLDFQKQGPTGGLSRAGHGIDYVCCFFVISNMCVLLPLACSHELCKPQRLQTSELPRLTPSRQHASALALDDLLEPNWHLADDAHAFGGFHAAPNAANVYMYIYIHIYVYLKKK